METLLTAAICAACLNLPSLGDGIYMPKHAVETELGLREQALLYDEYRAIWIKQSGIAGMALGDTKQYGKLYQRRVPYMFIKHKRFTAVATMNSVEIDYVWRYE